MKTRGLLALTTLLLIVAFVPIKANADEEYSATLISPSAGQVLYPGQKVKVQWKSTLPRIDLTECETEVWLSLDGGRTFQTCITPILDPKGHFFYWTVPNMPTNAAVLDIRFGCEGWYPESPSPQMTSMFVIASSPGGLY